MPILLVHRSCAWSEHTDGRDPGIDISSASTDAIYLGSAKWSGATSIGEVSWHRPSHYYQFGAGAGR